MVLTVKVVQWKGKGARGLRMQQESESIVTDCSVQTGEGKSEVSEGGGVEGGGGVTNWVKVEEF